MRTFVKHLAVPGVMLSAALVLSAGVPCARAQAPDCTRTSVGFVPLPELGKESYLGKEGGLYPKGSNTRPPVHEAAGLAIARTIRPLDAGGAPDNSGKIVFVSIGMSNTTQEFSTFIPMAKTDPDRDPMVVSVDCAVGGMTAARISDLADSTAQQYWQTVDTRLAAAGVKPAQVQVAWLKQANSGPKGAFPSEELTLQSQLAGIVRILKIRFPNIRIVYCSSRIYGGYATGALNPEPFAYQGGFAVKWLIEAQINGARDLNYDPLKGEVNAPWLAWGPYIWADGLKANSDGLTYACSDLSPSDGTHPAQGGAREKVAQRLLDFLKSDSTARLWYVRTDRRSAASLHYPALIAGQGYPYASIGTTSAGIAVANLDTGEATLTFTAFDRNGVPIAGPDITNPQSRRLASGAQLPGMDTEVFGKGISAVDHAGWFQLDSTAAGVAGFFAIMDSSVTLVDGVDVSDRLMGAFVIPEIQQGGFTELHLANPNAVAASARLELLAADGKLRAPSVTRRIEAGGTLTERTSDLFPSATTTGSDYVRIVSSTGLTGFAFLGKTDVYLKALNGQDITGGATTLYSPQYAIGGGWRSSLSIVNLDSASGKVTLAFYDKSGQQAGGNRTLDISAEGKIQIDAQDFFVDPAGGLMEGYVAIISDGIGLSGSASFGDDAGNEFATALPLVADLQQHVIFSQLASDSRWYTGVAIVNPNDNDATVMVEAFDSGGRLLGRQDVLIGPRQSFRRLITQYIPALADLQLNSGYIKLTASLPIASFAVYGSAHALSALPPQTIK